MRTATEFVVIAGVIGIIALVGVASAAAATGCISGAHGVSSSSNTGEGMMTNGNMSGGMNERCGMGQDMQGMMSGQGHMYIMKGNGQQCLSEQGMQDMTQNINGTWNCPIY